MMSQVKNWSKSSIIHHQLSIVLAVMLLAAGCKDKEQPVNPYLDPGNTENPHWAISVDTTNLIASMTAVVKVTFAQAEGSLAAFIGNDCCGIADYNADLGLYWLYISPATVQDGNVQLRFYSPDLKRIFDATSAFPFCNDTQQGTVAEPYTPEWKATK